MNKVKINLKSLKSFFSYIPMIFIYIFDVAYIWKNHYTLLESDLASEYILAKQLNSEGVFSFISNNWYYSTELRVLNTNIVNKIAFGLFPDNWRAARTVSVALLLLILAFSALYLMRAIDLKKYAPFFAALMLLPFGNWYSWDVIFNSYYVPHISISLVSVGLFIRIIGETHKKKLSVLLFSALVLSLSAGMGGVRQLMICYVPLGIASLIFIWKDHLKKSDVMLTGKVCEKTGSNLRSKIDFVKNDLTIRALIMSIIYGISAVIGFLINDRILAKHIQYSPKSAAIWAETDILNIWKTSSDLLYNFGWKNYAAYLSVHGIGNFMVIFMLITGVVCLIKLIKSGKADVKHRLAGYISLAVFSVHFFIYGFGEGNNYFISYWITYLPFFFLPIIIFISYEKRVLARTLTAGVVSLSLLMSSISRYRIPWDIAVPNNTNIKPVAEYLLENGYDTGIATFWYSGLITAYADGKIEMWTVNSLENLQINDWLQKADHMSSLPKGRTALIRHTRDLSSEDPIIKWAVENTTQNIVYRDDNYIVYEFGDIMNYIETVLKFNG